ncbi:TetR/AcrR family transcriptional regulator [Streptomyces sp. NPDC005576]|uniref:TetR/AcrR family transcriptional regulator n=1 Tax=unclassified Streptomyces TaxID=2593676 RepID=UPI0033D01E56
MTPGRRKRISKTPAARRSEILQAARRVFSEIGFAETKVADITDAAGIGKGTFYLHFDTKEHAMGVLWSEYLDEFYDSAERITAQEQEWWSTVDELLATLVGHVISHASLRRLVYGARNAQVTEYCSESNERLMDVLASFAMKGAASGALTVDKPVWAFSMVYHGAEWLLDNLLSTDDLVDTDQVIHSVLGLAHRALGGPPLAREYGADPLGSTPGQTGTTAPEGF